MSSNIKFFKSPFMKQSPIFETINISILCEDGYSFGRVLGRGHSGVVKELNKTTNGRCKTFACKSILRNDSMVVEDIKREVQLMASLSSHANVVQLEAVYENDNYVHIVMEYCSGGDLYHLIRKKAVLYEDEAGLVFKQLIETVAYFHEQGIMHRDLKPENILLLSSDPSSWKIKVVDFGIAAYIGPGEELLGYRWSPCYVAPEVLVGRYNTKADVWSCGVILYVMLYGQFPFPRENIHKIQVDAELEFPSYVVVSDEAKDLVKSMLNRDKDCRPSAHQVLSHPWMLQQQILAS